MPTNEPDMPNAEAQRPPAPPQTGYAVALGIAAAAGVAALAVAAVLAHDLARDRPGDLLEPDELARLRARLARTPKDAQLAERIRQVDLDLRREYFAHVTRARFGHYLLLGGLGVFLAGAAAAAALARRIPHPSGKPADVAQEMRGVRRGRRAVTILGGLLVVGALAPLGVQAYIRLTAVPPPPPHTADPEEVARNWPRFRGPGGLGTSAYTNIPTEWDANTGRNILWKTPVPLPGKSSPIVWGGRIFLTGAKRDRREVYGFDAVTGKRLWTAEVRDIRGSPPRSKSAYEETGYAAPTPVCDDERVFALFPNGDLACFDHAGRRVWATGLGQPDNQYTHGSSLAMYRNLVLVLWDQGSLEDYMSKLLAFDGETGRLAWQKRRPVGSSWATPALVDDDARPQLLTSANPWVISYDPGDGRELWRAKCMDGADAASSAVYAGSVAYAVSAETELYAIGADGAGDVTETHVRWSADEGLPDLTSPLTDGKRVWLLQTGGTLTCYDAGSGKKLYDHELEKMFNASPSLVGETIYLVTTKGVTFVVGAGAEFKLLHTNPLGEVVYACPAFADGRMYLRGRKHLFCIAEKTDPPAADR